MSKRYLIIGFVILAIVAVFLLVLRKPIVKQQANQQAAQPIMSGFQNASGQNELNITKKAGNLFLTVTGARVIPNSQVRPHLNNSAGGDILMLDLLFAGGDNCQKGCEISSFVEDYRLVDQNGFLKDNQRTTLWESLNDLGPEYLKPGEESKRYVYFPIDTTDNGDYTFYYTDITFYYKDPRVQQSRQFFNLKVGLN